MQSLIDFNPNDVYVSSNLNSNFTAIENAINNNTYYLSDYSGDLAAAVSAIGSNNTILTIDSNSTLTDNLTIPSNIDLRFVIGNTITTTGWTLTINSSIQAGEYQIFAGTGDVDGLNYVNSSWFNVVGDDSTDNSVELQKSASALTSGGYLYIPPGIYKFATNILFDNDNIVVSGDYGKTILKFTPDTVSRPFDIQCSGVIMQNLVVYDGSYFFNIGYANTPDNITIKNCIFDATSSGETVNSCIYLQTCTNIVVRDCIFDGTGYGVIQEAGKSSSHVTVTGCTALNMTADFVLANCDTSPSYDWKVVNNRYLGCLTYPTQAIEKRFAGTTGVEGYICTNNYIENSCGDAAVHLEAILGRSIVSNNIFKNCVGSFAYIYALNNAEDLIVDSNIFIHSDNSVDTEWVLNLNSGAYSNNVTFSNNHIYGDTYKKINVIQPDNQVGTVNVIGNTAENINAFCLTNTGLIGANINNNIVKNAYYGIVSPKDQNAGIQNVNIIGNNINIDDSEVGTWAATTAYVENDIVRPLTGYDARYMFKCTTAGTSGGSEPSWDLTEGNTTSDSTVEWTTISAYSAFRMESNKSGTGNPTEVNVTGNRFDGDFKFTRATDCIATSNIIKADYIDMFGALCTRCYQANNLDVGNGLVT